MHFPPPLPGVLVGTATPDDAGVFRIAPDLALVQTVDFFTPVVDDPYDFGRIAAVNALSDVYAMGARPITALNLAAFPATLDPALLGRILQGGVDVLESVGVALLGGHTVDDPEPKYGLAVTGTVHPDRILRKGGAKPGDRLLLTKPIGMGVATTAIKKASLSTQELEETVGVMLRLNNQVDALGRHSVHALTDITGFGLLGHLLEMLEASGVGAEISFSAVPLLSFAPRLAQAGLFPAGSLRNLDHVAPHTQFAPSLTRWQQTLLADAVTSGGLLIAVPASDAASLAQALLDTGALLARDIGRIVARDHGTPDRPVTVVL